MQARGAQCRVRACFRLKKPVHFTRLEIELEQMINLAQLPTNACLLGSARKMATLAVPGSPGPSRSRTHSVVSLSSELSDPSEGVATDAASSDLSEVNNDSEEDDDDDDEDDIVEVNADGSAKGASRIRDLVSNPPKHPKHRWETAVRYALPIMLLAC